MGDIIRRKRDDEIDQQVEARRVPPQVIVVPGMMPGQQPQQPAPAAQPPQEGPTHNHYIYVNVPSQSPQQQPPPPPQPEVHYHKTVHHYTRGGSSPRHQLSMLGVAALALGVIAIVIRFIPGASAATLPIAAIGFCLGLLGLLAAAFGGQSNAGVPFAGMFVCLIAAGISLYLTGWLPQAVDNIQKGQPVEVPPDLIPKVEQVDGQGAAKGTESSRGFNIWDYLPSGGAASSTDGKGASGDPAASRARQVAAAEAAVTAASQKLQALRDAEEKKVQSDPQFVAAKQSADAAHLQLREARATYEAGSSEVAAASKTWMEAVNEVGKIRTRLTDRAALEQAEKELAEAQARLQSLQAPAATPPAPATP